MHNAFQLPENNMSSLKAKLKAGQKPLTAPSKRNPVAHSDIMAKGGVHTKDTAKHRHRQSRRDSKQKLKLGNWF